MSENPRPELPVRLDDLIGYITRGRTEALDRVSDAVLAAEYLGEMADHVIGHFVDEARRGGASWTDIGRSMGVTKQAAQKRFVPKDLPEVVILDQERTFARFTARARHVIEAAQDAAREAGNDRIRPAHLVLGLLSEPESLAVHAVVEQGVSAGRLQGAATAALPPSVDTVAELIPFDAQSKKVLELTFRNALRLGHNYVGTEHLLLALLDFEDGHGLLSDLGVDRSHADAWLVGVLDGLSASGAPVGPVP